jgi:GNAT superfamily N-acetyltransferase
MTGGEAMETDRLAVRRMSESELGLALDWAAEEGWNPGLFDAKCFYAADRDGFLIGELDGAAVGCVSAVRYGAGFGFLGFYIVRPPWRGRGFGLKLWRAAMERLGARNVGLDGVLAQQENYKRSGFRLAWRNIRQGGVGGGAAPDGLTELSSVAFDAIARYDETVFRAPRASFLACWIRHPGSAALGVVKDGNLAGYGVIRACRRGSKIGPLFADDPETADRLFRGLASRAAGEPIFLDTPETNPGAIELAGRYGMARVFETARMYTREPPDIRPDRCFGVTTFELG